MVSRATGCCVRINTSEKLECATLISKGNLKIKGTNPSRKSFRVLHARKPPMDIPAGDTSNAYSEASQFLTALDCTTNVHCFQTFDDLKSRRERRLAATVRGTLEERFDYLTWMNNQAAGVFVAVNAIKAGCARKLENLERVRAVYQDDDNCFKGTYPIPPSITVRSSLEKFQKFQRYWLVADLSPEMHQAIMRRLVRDYSSDPNARDLVRVLRVPGFLHQKNQKNPHPVKLIDAPGWIYTADQIAGAFPPILPEPEKPKPQRSFNRSDNIERLLEALSYIDSDDRENWLRVGMALRLAHGDDETGRAIWDGWSQTSPKFDARDQEHTWRSFKRNDGHAVTISTIFYLARSNGFGGRRHAA